MKKKGSLYISFMIMTIIPILILGITIIAFSSKHFAKSMNFEVKTELKNIALSVIETYDLVYPGDYSSYGEPMVAVLKGEAVMNDQTKIIDKLKTQTGLDISIFYGGVRILTTLKDSNGNRLTETKANSVTVDSVITNITPQLYDNARINSTEYFAYYQPIINFDGSCSAMIAVGKPSSEVNELIFDAVLPIIVLAIIGMIVAAGISMIFSSKIIKVIKNIQKSLYYVSSGDLTKKVSYSVLNRNDELGEIGHSITAMQLSLHEYMDIDSLTKLCNRRSGNKLLHDAREKAYKSGTVYSIAIGDIDFFKRINDTYGHDCGDQVLVNVANILKRSMLGHGFVARWGGEEFLLVFEHSAFDEAVAHVNKILEDIRAMIIMYDGNSINITMTFGVVEGTATKSHISLFREADDKLYFGKEHGRDQVVGKLLNKSTNDND